MLVALHTVDIVWLLLALCFLIAFGICKFSLTLPGELEYIFQAFIRYGKTIAQTQQPRNVPLLYVPKRWFWHFYAVSVFWNGLLLFFSLRTVFLQEQLPDFLWDLLGFLTGEPKTAWGEIKLTILVLQALVWIHSFRRLLECLWVSVFSDGLINIVQYAFGMSYYILLGLTVLSVNASLTTEGISVLTFSQSIWHIAGVLLFLWASLLQHRSLSLLASLRTSRSGRVETFAHRMPHGGWFERVSCPHYLAELLIYTALSICCGCSSFTWWLVVLYVLCNQVLAAHLCHEYYRRTFKAYPPERKAIIPFLL
ncbi:polyprenol reductase precursor [Silurus asotus]|uniref:Polyprenal reductase n=1 Tax=Silurus asotus TaxID=30991 RepID=A0AAD5FLH6_SILAS|nr:polyprenol reductase precursor [Silurus asotus]